jgi:hypothetical protein
MNALNHLDFFSCQFKNDGFGLVKCLSSLLFNKIDRRRLKTLKMSRKAAMTQSFRKVNLLLSPLKFISKNCENLKKSVLDNLGICNFN